MGAVAALVGFVAVAEATATAASVPPNKRSNLRAAASTGGREGGKISFLAVIVVGGPLLVSVVEAAMVREVCRCGCDLDVGRRPPTRFPTNVVPNRYTTKKFPSM